MVVEAGGVHGFLGPNGSGKTTTLRTLLGLIKPNGGRMRVLGREVPEHLPEVVGRVGAIVESPQFFPHFTAQDTLSLLAVAEVLAQHRSSAVRVRVEPGVDLLAVAEVLRAAGAPQVSLEQDHLMVAGVDRPAWITWVLAQRGVWV